jgi:phosphoribosylformylglycinamidine synthase subunit PurS
VSEAEIDITDVPATTTTTWLARIHVTLKPVVLDPQGDAVLHGLHQLGYADVSSVRVGKYLEVHLTATSAQAAGEAVRQMCERLLANPVIESYNYEVEGSEPPIASGASASQPA